MKIRSLINHINVLNIVLLSIALFVAYHLYYQAYKVKAIYTIPVKEKATEGKIQEQAEETKSISPLEYTIISDQNLFHQDRRIPPEKKAGQELPKPEIVLYGTLLTGDTKIAYLEDLKAPRTTPGRGKRQTALRQGQSISGFKLEEIHEDRIVMVRGEEKMEIKVMQNQDKKPRSANVNSKIQTAPSISSTQIPPKTTPLRK